MNGCVSRITVRTEEIELSSQFYEESLKYILYTVSSEFDFGRRWPSRPGLPLNRCFNQSWALATEGFL
jgi:hypothetical protein